MKNNFLKVIIFSALSMSSFAFSQKVIQKKVAKVKLKSDSLAILEAKKKAAAAEFAKLPKPYSDKENATLKIAELVKKAKAEHKNVMIQAGGNWCIWCLRFNSYVQNTAELKELVDKKFVYYHLNFSPENKNEKVFEKYGNPGAKFGYPVFIVLDGDGKQIHTQDSSILEEGKGYSLEKTKAFFTDWSPKM